MVTYLPRTAWGARASRGPVALNASQVVGEALHWPGMAKPIDATGADGQRRIASALRGWQNYHMDTRGWSDIAYQVAVDQAGRAWTLRGLNIRSGANGDADVNLKYGAFLLILAPGEKPSAAMIATTKGVIADFRKRFPKARAKPYGHRDVRPAGTDCPGPITYAAIQAGTFTPSNITQSGDDMALTDAEWTRLGKLIYDKNAEYGRNLWAEPSGTGTALRKDVDDIQAVLADVVARLQSIEDVIAGKA